MTAIFVPLRKGTVLIPTGPTNHLHFICCDPVHYHNQNKECVLAVNISSIDEDIECDQTCTLNVGDHPFIKNPSYVYYRKAEIFGADNISRNVAEGNFIAHQPCNDATFNRILNGFEVSEEVRFKIKRFYEMYCK